MPESLMKDMQQPSWNHAFVTFNNQDSVLLSMSVPEKELLCLLHDNRIFAFKKIRANDNASSSSDEQNVILNLLTTPKYRVMSALYLIFRLLDNINLVSIIVLSILDGDLTTPTPANLALFSVIGLEVFYDIMLLTNKYWILDRLSIYIGIVLYGAYAGIVAWKHIRSEYEPKDLQILIAVLSIRFVAFIFEECVDIAIDGELHNDLLKLKNQKITQINIQEAQREEFKQYQEENLSLFRENTWSKYMDVSINLKMPENVDYRGSFFAWSPQSVFNENVWREDQVFPRWLVYILCLPPFVVASFLLVLLIVLCFLAFLIPVMLAYVLFAIYCCTCNPGKLKEQIIFSNFWKELTHI